MSSTERLPFFRVVPPQGRTPSDHARVAAMQRLRGAAYVADGALPPTALDADGRHRSPHDDTDYHVLIEHADGALAGGYRLCLHDERVKPADLHLAAALQRMPAVKHAQHEEALRQLMARARMQRRKFGEVSAWALRPADRNRQLAIELPLSGFALFELLGSAFMVAHATQRNHSAQILKRLGGSSLALDGRLLEPMYDPTYDCMMEFVCFASDQPAPAFAKIVDRLRIELGDRPPFTPEMSLRRAA